MINKCLEHDFKYWKTANFIKNPDDNEAVKKVITENIVPLKKVFHYLMASSVYPGIGWNDYSLWAGKIKIPDEKTVQSKVDMAFTAVNVQIEKIEGNSNNENSMCRFQFLEVVVRLAKAKYYDTGVEKTPADAVTRLIRDNLMAYDYTDEW